MKPPKPKAAPAKTTVATEPAKAEAAKVAAAKAEAALNGAEWSETAFEQAARALAQDFTPLSDWRASSEYRMLAAQNLLRRFFLEHDEVTSAPIQLATA